jgi:hypothetical protein
MGLHTSFFERAEASATWCCSTPVSYSKMEDAGIEERVALTGVQSYMLWGHLLHPSLVPSFRSGSTSRVYMVHILYLSGDETFHHIQKK